MSDALYEQYKEALRRGHVAALRGRLDAAVAAYTQAATIAPDRALPNVSLGQVLLKLGRAADALVAFEAALRRAPRDEAGLAGRADALAALRRRVDAAESLDSLSRIQEAAGRLAEACDTARRALELAESRERRRHVSALAQRLRDVPADDAAAAALERALGMLEPVSAPAPSATSEAPSATIEPDASATATAPVAAEPGAAGPVAAESATAEPVAAAAERAAAPEPVATEEPAIDPVALTSDALRLSAEAADRLDARDAAGARNAFVAAASAHRSAGNLNAALDACYLALDVAPADADLHLLLARLYVDRGWHAHANEKLRLLDRLTGLTGERRARSEVRRFVAALADVAGDLVEPPDRGRGRSAPLGSPH